MSPIWLKIGMVAGNNLNLSLAKYFSTFISKKLRTIALKWVFLENNKKCIIHFVDPPKVIEKSGGNNFWSYVPKDFAGKGIYEISQGACALEPAKGWTRFRPSNYSPCS